VTTKDTKNTKNHKEHSMPDANGCGVLWDMDGTLVDTAELHFEAWRLTSEELGRAFTRADFAATFGRRNPEIIEYLFPQRFTSSDVDLIGECKERLYRTEAERLGVTLLPGVEALMAGLHERGVQQAIGSSAPRANLDLILCLTGIERFLSAIVSAEDTTRGKPDPQVFLTAAARLHVPARRCLVFEDAPAGVEAAKAGGMKCIAVRFVGHHSADKLAQAGADRVVASLTDVSPEDVLQLLS
jgi:beta-phosphoglucomutase